MARRKAPTTKVDPSAFDSAGANVYDNPVKTEIEDSYLEYAYSVIHSRALPDARDGLKPVHRRILFSMSENGYRPSHAYVKSSRVVGDCMGRYHPHGDVAIYDAMVRMAQDFSLNAPLVDGHGNFGSPDDGPAASRYCVVGDTRISMADGSRPRIADVVNLPANAEADADFDVLDKDGKAVHVSKVFNSGVHPTVRITSESGVSLRGSENHLVLCLESPAGVPMFLWHRLDELTPGSIVCLADRPRGADRVPLVDEYVFFETGLDDWRQTEDTEVRATVAPIMESTYRFERLTAVEPGAPEEVYSVRVDSEDHSFLAGGFVNHNTEARMSPEAMLLVGELGEETVDFRPNYDGSLQEPVVLPAAFPNLLVNGTSGIAVGMATNMIPHNLGEVVGAARWLIHHPNADLDKLMEFVPGPDLPTGGMLLGLDEVRKAYETGRGVVRMRAKVEIGPLEGSRGRQAITVTELPYQVGSEKIIEKITDEVNKSKRLTGIADVKDLTDRENGTRLVIECKVGVNPQALLADLYRLTPMEQSFGINNLVLVEGQPRTLGLKPLLEVFLAHRYEVVTRRTKYRKRKREDRLHLVEGLLKALLDIDKVIRLIRNSDDAQEAKDGLMKRFKLSEIQATYILDTPLRRLTKYDKLELESEQAKLLEEVAELAKILDDDAELKKVVSRELAAVAKDHTQERRTSLIDGDLKEVLEASKPAGPLEVADDPCQVILSATGLLARTGAESEEVPEARKRSGRARHDAVAAIVHTTARGQVLVITNKGRAIKTDVLPLPVLPEAVGTVSLRGGMAASEVAALPAGEKVVGIAPVVPDEQSPGLAMGTRNGVVKVCSPEWPVRSDEFEVIGLKDDDEVVGAIWLRDGTEMLTFMASDSSLLRYDANLVRPQGLKGGGMAGIKLAADAHAVFFGAIRTDDDEHGEPMVVTSTGQSVKVTPFAQYPPKGRATGGVRTHRFLKGENGLALAWVGPRPAGVTSGGSPVELPEVDLRRDGSGHAHPGPEVVGHLIERG
jgi:DNA gyrase subunit A